MDDDWNLPPQTVGMTPRDAVTFTPGTAHPYDTGLRHRYAQGDSQEKARLFGEALAQIEALQLELAGIRTREEYAVLSDHFHAELVRADAAEAQVVALSTRNAEAEARLAESDAALRLAWPGIVAELDEVDQDDVTVPIGVAHEAASASLRAARAFLASPSVAGEETR